MSDKYILDGMKPIIERDVERWGKWMEGRVLQLAHTWVTSDIEVYTSFIGEDRCTTKDRPPLVFETVVSGASNHGHDRYSTWTQAIEGHSVWVEWLSEKWLGSGKEGRK